MSRLSGVLVGSGCFSLCPPGWGQDQYGQPRYDPYYGNDDQFAIGTETGEPARGTTPRASGSRSVSSGDSFGPCSLGGREPRSHYSEGS
jgi:hypothetical protein